MRSAKRLLWRSLPLAISSARAAWQGTSTTVQKEMAEPRKARSVRIAERKLDTAQIAEEPSAQMPGTVNKIIPARRAGQPEKAQIAVDGADRRPQGLRIENELIDEDGGGVKLKKGARVDVTITAEPTKTANP
jgi:hypothetical protein